MKITKEARDAARASIVAALKTRGIRLSSLATNSREEFVTEGAVFIVSGHQPGTRGPQVEMHTAVTVFTALIGKTGAVGVPMAETNEQHLYV